MALKVYGVGGGGEGYRSMMIRSVLLMLAIGDGPATAEPATAEPATVVGLFKAQGCPA